MIWDFKRRLYCTAQRINIATCPDLTDPVLQERLQRHCDASRRFPARGAEEEYAAYFEAAYPDAGDRRRYIDRAVRDGRPSFGHVVLGSLLSMDAARTVWTTNFDTMVEDATLPLLESSTRLTVASIETGDIARTALTEGRDPVIIKLHGDFRSRRLKNVEVELRQQDDILRGELVEECRRSGLAVIGYSGRDTSVMDALNEAVSGGRGYPSGFFWFYREDSPPSDSVQALVNGAVSAGVDAHLIGVETFDELMGDIIAQYSALPEKARSRLQSLDRRASRVSDAPVPPPSSGLLPLIRLNALPVLAMPAVCRRVVCEVGNTKEVREAIRTANVPLIATRRKTGVQVFGTDAACRAAFGPFGITEFDIQPLGERLLTYDDSQEIGMLTEALAYAIARERPLLVVRRGRRFEVAVDRDCVSDVRLGTLARAAKSLSGTVPRTAIVWAEAVRLSLQHRAGRLWLLLEPKIWHSDSSDEAEVALAREFTRGRLASRYNKGFDDVLTGWIDIITLGAQEAHLRAFGIAEGSGVDAAFVVGKRTAFSRRHDSLPSQAQSASPYRDS